MNSLSDAEAAAVATRRIFVVEDSSDDLFFLQRALGKAGCALPVDVVTDGHQALEFLERIAAPAGSEPPPALMLLDLKLPRRSGFEVLEWMQGRPEFADTLKVVLTGSQEERDVNRAFGLGADAYVPKPIEVEDLKIVLTALEDGSWKVAAEEPTPLPGLKRQAA